MNLLNISRKVLRGGGIYRGIQTSTGQDPLVLFNVPDLETTLAVNLATLSAKSVKKRIRDARREWKRSSNA